MAKSFGRDSASNKPASSSTKDRTPNGDVSWRPQIANPKPAATSRQGSRQAVVGPSNDGLSGGDARGSASGDQVDLILKRDG